MVRISIRYDGDLRCRAVHGPSKTELSTDAPVDNQGKGESFSPTDLCATALGTCMLTTMGIVAARHGWSLEGSTVEVEKSMIADPTRRIGRLDVVIRVPAQLDERARAVLEKTALTCPVHRSLREDVEIPVRFEWGSSRAS
jgi:putative redox protein